MVTAYGVSLIAQNLGRRRKARILLADLDGHRVGSGLGEIITRPDGGPEVRVEQTRIPVPDKAPPLPARGRYRLYWLERSNGERLLLSADADDPGCTADAADRGLPPGFSADEAARLRRAILKAFQLTQADLADNRAGRVSPRQRRGWVQGTVSAFVVWVVVGGLSGSCVVGNLLKLTAPDPDPGAGPAVVVRGMALVVLVLLLGSLGMLVRWVARHRSDPPVLSLTGPVTLTAHEDSWSLSVPGNELTFSVSRPVGEAFRAPGTYTLYYVDDDLLAAEPVPADESWERSDRPLFLDDPDLVAANAAGRVTAGQRRLLLGQPVPVPWAHLVGGLALYVLVTALGPAAQPYSEEYGHTWVRTAYLIGSILLLLSVVTAWWRTARGRRQRQAAFDRSDICTDIGAVAGRHASVPSAEPAVTDRVPSDGSVCDGHHGNRYQDPWPVDTQFAHAAGRFKKVAGGTSLLSLRLEVVLHRWVVVVEVRCWLAVAGGHQRVQVVLPAGSELADAVCVGQVLGETQFGYARAFGERHVQVPAAVLARGGQCQPAWWVARVDGHVHPGLALLVHHLDLDRVPGCRVALPRAEPACRALRIGEARPDVGHGCVERAGQHEVVAEQSAGGCRAHAVSFWEWWCPALLRRSRRVR